MRRPSFRRLVMLTVVPAAVAVSCTDGRSDSDGRADGGAAGDGVDVAGEGGAPDRLTAIYSSDIRPREDLRVSRCVAEDPGTLRFSGTADDGFTVHVSAGARTDTALVGGRTGAVTELGVDARDGRFHLVGELRREPGADEAPGTFTLSGRCAR